MGKNRYRALFATPSGQIRAQLVEGTVTKVDGSINRMDVKIEATSVTGALKVVIYVAASRSYNTPARPTGFGVEATSGGSIKLVGDLQKLPKPGQKVLMHLLFIGTEGFCCIAWTLKTLVEAAETFTTLSYGKVKASKHAN